MVDSRGLVTSDRANVEPFKAAFARAPGEVAAFACRDRPCISLPDAIANIRPTILLGTSGTAGLFTEEVIRAMAAVARRPIVFPLSNPTSKSECTADQAIRWSDGRAIVATGSPFAPVTFGGRTCRIGQANNAFIFPGVGLGLWVGRVRRVTDRMFLEAAKALAAEITNEDLAEGAVYPALTRIRTCSRAIASAVVRCAVAQGHADPSQLDDLDVRLARAMWRPEYLPLRYEPAGQPDELLCRTL
jgi:malic enzyme